MTNRQEKLADIFYQVWFNASLCACAIRHIKKILQKWPLASSCFRLPGFLLNFMFGILT